MKKILVVEDDARIAATVRDFLVHAGFEVRTETHGLDALDVFRSEKPDLVILDLNLPGMDGIKICRAIRDVSAVPVIMLTARREESDQLQGLKVGADDYVIKPFSPIVLVAKVERMLQRPPLEDPEIIRLQDLTLDVKQRLVQRGEIEIDLTPVEFNLLWTLARGTPKTYSRDQLLDLIYDDVVPPDIFDRTIDSHVKNVRKKLSPGDYIQTVRGLGYRAVDK